MRLSSLVNLGLIAVGAAASAQTLRRRHRWEQSNQRTCIVLDYDDALAVCTRAAMPLSEFLAQARAHGATHVALPELTLQRLIHVGRLARIVPVDPIRERPPVGQWVYLASAETDLLDHVAREFSARLPSSNAHILADPHTSTCALAGHLPALLEMGLGFETKVAAEIVLAGLGLVPRPVSFAWPEDRLIARTMIQVAGLGAKIVAFDGDLILGHEMHLDATATCLERLGLQFAYFCETRHQKGDWFVAKRLAPKGQVILAHYLTPAAMVPEDFHSAAHHWGMLAHMRGIRLCYVNVFRHIHATHPLECLQYLAHIRENLEAFDGKTDPGILPAPGRESLALTSLASAGSVSLAATRTLGLSEPAALALTASVALGAASAPFLDRPRSRLEEAYPPSYAPKLIALAAAACAPLAADEPLTGALVQAGVAAALAALTTGLDYQLRIEEYRSLNIDWVLPLAGVLWRDLDDPRLKTLALMALGLGWYAANRISPDLLGELDKDLPAGHTHHLSAAQRWLGDAVIALGPRPGRKWAGLGLMGLGLARRLRPVKRQDMALLASILSVVGNAMLLAAFRKPERPLAATLPLVARSWTWGGGVALLMRVLR
jgi:hypothetical protein